VLASEVTSQPAVTKYHSGVLKILDRHEREMCIRERGLSISTGRQIDEHMS